MASCGTRKTKKPWKTSFCSLFATTAVADVVVPLNCHHSGTAQ